MLFEIAAHRAGKVTLITGTSTGTAVPPTGCSGAAPGPGWTCVSGAWVAPTTEPTAPAPAQALKRRSSQLY